MRAYRLSLVTVGATFALLLLGGTVQASGSALACPDWPLCRGGIFPLLGGGVAAAWGHRLAAMAVGILTVGLCAFVLRRESDAQARLLAVAAVVLLAAQAALGAVSVLAALPLLAAAGHLALSMLFLAVLLALASRLRPAPAPGRLTGRRGLVGAATAATYGLLVLGGLVRYAGAGLACGDDITLCAGGAWPAAGLAQLHMLHRYSAIAVGVLVIAATLRPAMASLRRGAMEQAVLAFAAPALLFLQIGLGQLSILAQLPASLSALHLALGALLLADLVALYLSLAPAGEGAPAGRPRRLATAAS